MCMHVHVYIYSMRNHRLADIYCSFITIEREVYSCRQHCNWLRQLVYTDVSEGLYSRIAIISCEKKACIGVIERGGGGGGGGQGGFTPLRF